MHFLTEGAKSDSGVSDMLEVQTLDELERMVTIAELQAATIEAACHPDDAVMRATEQLERKVANSLDEHLPQKRSHLFALKVRLGAALDRMRQVRNWRTPAFH
jgi:uncharacterized protein YhaN